MAKREKSYLQKAPAGSPLIWLSDDGAQCSICGAPGARYTARAIHTPDDRLLMIPGSRVYCRACADRVEEMERQYGAKDAALSAYKTVENALRCLDEQPGYTYGASTQRAAAALYKRIMAGVKLRSTDEATAYLLMLEGAETAPELWGSIVSGYGVKIDGQQYDLDFFLPCIRVGLEIDGEMHRKSNAQKEDQRDEMIRAHLIQETGQEEWEIIRIPTTTTRKNAAYLLREIISIAAAKRQIRAEHGGILPEGFRGMIRGYSNWKQETRSELLQLLDAAEKKSHGAEAEFGAIRHLIWLAGVS